jgi:methylated-DNA-[protein]-cysteine S-methyltransferase
VTSAAALSVISYIVPGFGVGELVFSGDALIAHDEPAPRPARQADTTPVQEQLVARLGRYYAGQREHFGDVDLTEAIRFAGATPFEARVIRLTQAVGYGRVVSYSQLARRAGHPRAQRAVGSVMARGTLPILVPYHRVIRADGHIGRYGPSGVAHKRRLLALEGVGL